MELHIRLIGIILVGLALAHIVFPSYFNWKEELKPLSLINRQMMIVHTFFIALTVFLMGILCITSTEELVHTSIGKAISLGFGVFWGTRLVVQFVGYSAELWQGKRFETVVHVVFSLMWAYFTFVFLTNYFV